MIFEKLWKELSQLEEVTAIALGGSRATGKCDERSDYDLYIYCTAVPDESARRAILERYCSYIELGNRYWELEDDCTLNSDVDIDILYRDPAAFEAGLASVVEGFCASNGYTTCMWHNLRTCAILYDRDGVLAAMKKRFDVPYPEQLRTNIIERNRKLLSGRLPSYDAQIIKASRRGDTAAVNHRTAAFLESYFDIVFALNRMTHPGEKRMLETALQEAIILPENFEDDIRGLLVHFFDNAETVSGYLERIVARLDDVILIFH